MITRHKIFAHDPNQKNTMYFNFTPNITVEYTLTPNSVNLPVLVASAFKLKLKLDRSHGSTFRLVTTPKIRGIFSVLCFFSNCSATTQTCQLSGDHSPAQKHGRTKFNLRRREYVVPMRPRCAPPRWFTVKRRRHRAAAFGVSCQKWASGRVFI